MSDDAKTVVMPGASSPGTIIPPGTVLNGIYKIDRVVGSGGMGVVYRGHTVMTGDAVAIKVIRAEMAHNDSALALFRKEAAVLHTLNHEAIVRYYVFSIDPGIDRPYLATEFVDGKALADILTEAPLPRKDVLTLAARLADGLQAAHKLNIVHRDISPDNVILPDGDVNRAKIIDFGIARAQMIGGGTVIGDSIAGKFDYMSPEQVGLYGGNVTPKSDIYSLGIVLAECALGRMLDMGGTQVQVVEKRRSVPDLSEIEPKLRALLAQMLQPKPEDRPAAMTDVAEAARKLSHTKLKPAGSGGAMRYAAAVALVLLVAGGGGAAYLVRQDTADAPLPPPEITSGPILADTDAIAPAGPPRGEDAPPPSLPPTMTTGANRSGDEPQGLADDPAAAATLAEDDSPAEEREPDEPDEPVAEPVDPPQDPPADDGPTVRNDEIDPDSPVAPAGDPGDGVLRYVRQYDSGRCTLLRVSAYSETSARVEAYGPSVAPFVEFDQNFTETMGFEANIGVRPVTEAQCAALQFMRDYRGADTDDLKLELDDDLIRPGDALTGAITGLGERDLLVFVVAHNGQVYPLTGMLTRGTDSASLHTRIRGATGQSLRPHLVIAVAADAVPSLIDTTRMPASEFFPMLTGELESQTSVDAEISYFKFGA